MEDPNPDARDVQAARQGHKKRTKELRDKATFKEHVRNAVRFLHGCAEFVSLGDVGVLLTPGETEALSWERVGRTSPDQFDAVNEQFCRRWLDRWVDSAEAVLAVVGLEAVLDLVPSSPAAKITKDFYVQILKNPGSVRVRKRVLASLRETRADLGPARFDLQDWFVQLSAETKRVVQERQQQEGREKRRETARPVQPPDSQGAGRAFPVCDGWIRLADAVRGYGVPGSTMHLWVHQLSSEDWEMDADFKQIVVREAALEDLLRQKGRLDT